MKILFVSTFFPRDLHTKVHGVYKRMRMFIDGIKEIANLDVLFYVPPDIDVSSSSVSELERSFSEHWNTNIKLFLCPIERIKNEDRLSRWLNYGAGAFKFVKQSGLSGVCESRQIKALETCLSNNPDAIFIHRLRAMVPLLLTNKILPPVFFDLDDIEHIALKRNIPQLSQWYAKLLCYTHLPSLLLGELRAIRLAEKTFVCSESDRHYLTNRWRLPGICIIPNAVTIPENQSLTLEPNIIFVGSYSYKPNIDAAEFLIEKVWPRIHQAMPTANLIVAGNNPGRIRCYAHDIPGVRYAGFVDDIDTLYRTAKIVCAPILSGAGTRVKIIEAAAYGKPIVATYLGAEGLEMHHGKELLLHDDPISFSEACLSLLRDHSLCEKLGFAARARAAQLYDRINIVQLIKKQIENEKNGTNIFNMP